MPALDPMDPRLTALHAALRHAEAFNGGGYRGAGEIVSAADAFLGWLSPTPTGQDDGDDPVAAPDPRCLHQWPNDDQPREGVTARIPHFCELIGDHEIHVCSCGATLDTSPLIEGDGPIAEPWAERTRAVGDRMTAAIFGDGEEIVGTACVTFDVSDYVAVTADRDALLAEVAHFRRELGEANGVIREFRAEVVATHDHRDDLARQLRVMREQVDRADPAVPDGCWLIAGERARQIFARGWTGDHDDSHTDGELIGAAMAYAAAGWGWSVNDAAKTRKFWPWDVENFHPSESPIVNLVRAGALIAAEIDRRTRAEQAVIGPNIADPKNKARVAATLMGTPLDGQERWRFECRQPDGEVWAWEIWRGPVLMLEGEDRANPTNVLDTICARLNVDRKPTPEAQPGPETHATGSRRPRRPGYVQRHLTRPPRRQIDP